MRQPKDKRSMVEYPLDYVLGSPAAIRLLRVVLHEAGGAIGVVRAAQLAGTTVAGARRALERLSQLGVIRSIGSARTVVYEICADSPFVELLTQLFDEEYLRSQALINQIRQCVSVPFVVSAWYMNRDQNGKAALAVFAIVEPSEYAQASTTIRRELDEIEHDYDVLIELFTSLEIDAPCMDDDAVLLWGFPPRENLREDIRLDNEMLATYVEKNPDLVLRARRYTDRLLSEGQGIADADIREWRDLLDLSRTNRVVDMLRSESQRAQRLRRSEPFAPILRKNELRHFVSQTGREK